MSPHPGLVFQAICQASTWPAILALWCTQWNIASAANRVPDELKRHSLTDKFGSQYSTNLDRNRYGTDNQYLSTVIRYDLDYLNLCPCLIDVEIIDAKNGNGTVIVSAGDHACSCTSQPVLMVRQLVSATCGILSSIAWHLCIHTIQIVH